MNERSECGPTSGEASHAVCYVVTRHDRLLRTSPALKDGNFSVSARCLSTCIEAHLYLETEVVF